MDGFLPTRRLRIRWPWLSICYRNRSARKRPKRLAADVRAFKHITTGFLGTPLICQVLSDYGYFDEAYMLLNRTEYPSWLYRSPGMPPPSGALGCIKPDGSSRTNQ